MVLTLVFGFILGSILGSLVKVLADRSLANKSFWGRSYCEKCKKTLSPYDLFPILSYLLLKGRCRYCQTPIAIEYLLIEVLMGLLIALLFLLNVPANFLILPWYSQVVITLDTIFKAFAIVVFISLFLTDLKDWLIPDRISIPAIIISLIYWVALTIFKIFVLFISLSQDALGKYLLPPHSDYFARHILINAQDFLSALIAATIIALFFGSLIFITKGRGMGGGDLKLGIFMGLVLGFPNAIVAILLSFLMGSIVGLTLILFRVKKLKNLIPFGPFLVVGAIIALFWSEEIIKFYLNFRFPLTIF